jgi:hypothetical protein
MSKPTNRGVKMNDYKMIRIDGFKARKMMEKIEVANEQRKELDRKPIRVCDFMAEAVDRVTVAQLVRV